MKAYLKSYRQAPRKVRLVTNLIKGKTVPNALMELDALPKRASGAIKKLLLSAVANAKENNGIDQSVLLVKEVRVDQGMIMKRSMPRSRGSANPIHKHTSHIIIELVASAHGKQLTTDTAMRTIDKNAKQISKKTALAKVKAVVKPKSKSLKPKT